MALWSIPGINGLRQALVDGLRDQGVPIKQNFSFNPHSTMGYYEPGEAQFPGRIEEPIRGDFMHLVLFWGDVYVEYALGGAEHRASLLDNLTKGGYTQDRKTPPAKREAQGSKRTFAPRSGGGRRESKVHSELMKKAAAGKSVQYTLLPKDPREAFKVIQEMAAEDGQGKTAATRGGNPDNPGQFSSEDKGYRKKEKTKGDDSKSDSGSGGSGDGKDSDSNGGGGGGDNATAPAAAGSPGSSDSTPEADGESFGARGLSEILNSGGFSMKDRSGTPPAGGFMLSLNKETEEIFDLEGLTAETLEDYYERHQSVIEEEDKYVGAWVDDGKVYMDVSTNMEGSVEEVIAAAEAADQLAIWDVTGAQTIFTSLKEGGDDSPDQGEGSASGGYPPETQSFYTKEERIARGDEYGVHLPAGKYPEGDPRNDPEMEELFQRKTDLVMGYVAVTKEEIDAGATEGGETISIHDSLYDASTGKSNRYTPERARLHQQIMKDLADRYKDYPREGKAKVMAGPPGAGKSTFLRNYGSEFGIEVNDTKANPDANPSANYVTINPDDFKEFLPVDMERYPGLEPNEVAMINHEESSFLAKQVSDWFMERGYNVIIDITLGKAASAQTKYYDRFADKYDYEVMLVDGDMANSRTNAGIRYKQPHKETGVRSYGGRFLPMDLVEYNAPTEEGYRSKNAQEFMKFIQLPGVSRATVYDPYNPDAGVQDADTARRLTTASLSNKIRAGGRGMSTQTTEITTTIEKYSAGQMSLEQLVDWLLKHEYQPQSDNPHTPGTPEWYYFIEENDFYEPGTTAEIDRARNVGLLDWPAWQAINDAFAKAAKGG